MTPTPSSFTSSTPPATLEALQRFIAVIAQLRNPDGGCPWDLAQTPQTLAPYVLEEAYEVVDALQSGSRQDIAEELGDLLLQVVLQSQIFSESGDFDLGDVARGITAKMIRRHPHVFGDTKADTPDQVHANWEQIKVAEKAATEDPNLLTPKLRRYARTLPPLTAAMKISQKAAKAGFEWETLAGVWEKFDEELGELHQALDHEPIENQEAELGDLLFTLLKVARWRGLDPVAALQGTNRRFIQRFERLEAAAERPLVEHRPEELEALWQKAKQAIIAESENR
ncbi:nucleoside triphosphate pyrophosphohydrolase [Romeria aff. gracilis LEGE 07310]|uniref:Nucleoside triphosphate pyrophosphohydrolase n=1 Tax=Vasconcelosia minhoensis LEGE 07310 TaxID=915328 RepID=A0A8J7AK38_9CYAN|nr:nucleoside triphosphate pyrophosphohydrolase [Romeria gracilis]MBE9076695.1 nucleoside triphosphate pyrophosphohydrolase [Romeria aff. gracilis LEGE 07310]